MSERKWWWAWAITIIASFNADFGGKIGLLLISVAIVVYGQCCEE
jgi:hypothetical protein